MSTARSTFKQLLRSAEADLALLTRAACTLRAGKPSDGQVYPFSDQQHTAGARGAADPWVSDIPLRGSTADVAGNSSTGDDMCSSSFSVENLLRIRRRIVANLDAAEAVLPALRASSSAQAGAAGSVTSAARAQARHFADLLLAARTELAAVGSTLDECIERRALLGTSSGGVRRDRAGDSVSFAEGEGDEGEAADASALKRERSGLLSASSSVQELTESGFSALQQLRSQRQRQQRQQQLLLVLHSGVLGTVPASPLRQLPRERQQGSAPSPTEAEPPESSF
ncbi:hypothetical protein cyc_00196 [Cyclospora cayetanensis]|uniref:Uncharacterized protein n=1 Tax=Cyclospora cayetanensis TaxID=88456 RepID=A0A1D3D687_9EIME|nr:hypothetical protein cyc_00196 [Cyclospora cayetanensis]